MPVDILHIDWSDIDLNDRVAVKALLHHLANLVEVLHRENLALKAENQRLKDENNRLKGEKGRPDIKPESTTKKDGINKDLKPKREWKKDDPLRGYPDLIR